MKPPPRKVKIFSGDEKKIPYPTGSLPNMTPFNLTVSAQFRGMRPNRHLRFYLVPTPPVPMLPHFDDDGPLDIRIPPTGCRITLTLDDSMVWEFRRPDPSKPQPGPNDFSQDAVTVADIVPPNLYTNLVHLSATQVSFDAAYNAGPTSAAHHAFNLYVFVFQEEPVGPLKIKIDPDILNPGDHHMIGSHRRFEVD